MIDIENETDTQINYTLLENIVNSIISQDVEIILTDNSTIQGYNRQYRDIDKPTDVLSFPIENITGYEPAGTVIISLEYAKNISDELGHSLDEEVALLLIHGLLHLSGYDHEIDNGEMRDKEEYWIKEFRLPKSLIVRTQN
ncbi:MAG: rRNA maturation RNase YbeY [Sulfurovaceae bacterium]|nr:rRNA maturation RNase YbeY [Sulfurovaceae bacterium]MDD5549146.1 rRNA maturation RNase YbeY [Sulfurovaceae bacterium]